MRREDRRMPEEEAWQVLAEAGVCRLGVISRTGRPLVVPLSHVLLDGKLYFHSATEGEKVAAIGEAAEVCVEVDEVIVADGTASTTSRQLDCQGYRSVIARGTARPLRAGTGADRAARDRVLAAIITKYNPNYKVEPGTIERTLIFEVEIAEITGKAKR
jgi:nitroimidazol reductase NimA-like FMN-containing flavoprotein (pyridoxamine 5'-phosphate oxidase superfamily)